MTEIQIVDGPKVTTKTPFNGYQQSDSLLTISDDLIYSDAEIELLVTEDDEPVDNIASEKQQRLLTEPLYTFRDTLPCAWPFLVLANVGLFYAPKKPAIVPDVLFSLGVRAADNLWEKRHRVYLVQVMGKLPEVVIEIVSNNKGGEDSTKLQTYAQIGILYYVIFDEQNILSEDTLRVYKRDEKTQLYQQITQAWFPELGLGLRLWSGEFEGMESIWLRWCDEAKAVIPTGEEGMRQEKVEKELAQQQIEQEHQRAEQERQKTEQLIAQLRALGIEPKVGH